LALQHYRYDLLLLLLLLLLAAALLRQGVETS
jgi:hypothetical protein